MPLDSEVYRASGLVLQPEIDTLTIILNIILCGCNKRLKVFPGVSISGTVLLIELRFFESEDKSVKQMAGEGRPPRLFLGEVLALPTRDATLIFVLKGSIISSATLPAISLLESSGGDFSCCLQA